MSKKKPQNQEIFYNKLLQKALSLVVNQIVGMYELNNIDHKLENTTS